MSEVVERLAQARVLPVLSAPDADGADAACRALLAGGISCVEITFRTDADAQPEGAVARDNRALLVERHDGGVRGGAF